MSHSFFYLFKLCEHIYTLVIISVHLISTPVIWKCKMYYNSINKNTLATRFLPLSSIILTRVFMSDLKWNIFGESTINNCRFCSSSEDQAWHLPMFQLMLVSPVHDKLNVLCVCACVCRSAGDECECILQNILHALQACVCVCVCLWRRRGRGCQRRVRSSRRMREGGDMWQSSQGLTPQSSGRCDCWVTLQVRVCVCMCARLCVCVCVCVCVCARAQHSGHVLNSVGILPTYC